MVDRNKETKGMFGWNPGVKLRCEAACTLPESVWLEPWPVATSLDA